jgi:putative transposase
VGAVLAEQHDEWTEGRRYLGLDVLSRSRLTVITQPETEATGSSTGEHKEVTDPAMQALTA